MTDNDYAACIYCKIFGIEKADGDIYIRGVFDAIKSLEEREQKVLEYYCRNDVTYKQVGESIGVSGDLARKIVLKALRKLRHPSRSRNMRVPKTINEYKERLESSENETNELYMQTENIEQDPI